MAYTLAIGSASAVPLGSLGVVAAKLQENIEGKSSLTIETAAEISSSPVIMPFQRALLFDDFGSLRFAGWLDEAARSAQGSGEHRITYKLSGPHRWLERAPYVQNSGGVVKLGGSDEPQGWNEAYSDIVDVALSRYPGAFVVGGQTPFVHDIPTRTRADVDCLTAILSLVSYAPTCVFFWGYSGTTPVLNIADGTGVAHKTLSNQTYSLSAADINPRYDMLADVVRVYMTNSDGDIESWATAGPGGDAAAFGCDRTVIYTYDTSELQNLPETGLETALASWHQTLQIDASATQQGIDWGDRPGLIFTFGTGFSAFSGLKTLLNTITRDLMRGQTSLEFGVIAGKNLYRVSDLDSNYSATTSSKVSTLADSVAAATEAASAATANSISASNLAQSLEDALTGGDPTVEPSAADDLIKNVAALRNTVQPQAVSGVGWRTVERCDGKKMTVLGTDWW